MFDYDFLERAACTKMVRLHGLQMNMLLSFTY